MYQVKKLDVVWSLNDIEQLPYFYESFNDPDTVEQWDQIYKKKFTIGLQADYRVQQPACVSTVIENLQAQGVNLNNIGTSFYKMMPGDILPYHQDRYVSYCCYHNVDVSKVHRVIVFLQDWQPGFLFEIAGDPVSQYQAGTFVLWQGNTPHMAGNLGTTPRYTLQITGTIDDNI
jgi:hypothetical protein